MLVVVCEGEVADTTEGGSSVCEQQLDTNLHHVDQIGAAYLAFHIPVCVTVCRHMPVHWRRMKGENEVNRSWRKSMRRISLVYANYPVGTRRTLSASAAWGAKGSGGGDAV